MTLSTHSHPIDDGTTVTGTIAFAGACTVDDTITITDAAGTTKLFTAKGSTTAGSRQFINTDAAAAATALKLCIDNAAGFNETSITVADDTSGTLTITLLVDATYRFKNKASIQLMTGINANVTSVDFGGNAAAEDVDGGVILNAGTPDATQTHMNSPSTAKSPIEIVAGRKVSGSQIIASTGTANKVGIKPVESTGKLAYNPSEPSVTRSSTDTGFVMRGGVTTKIASVAASTIDFHARGSDNTARHDGGTGSIHVPDGIHKYSRKGDWSDTFFDLYTGKIVSADGEARQPDPTGTVVPTNLGVDASLATDNAATPTRAIPGELTILFNHVTFTSNNLDYSAITG